MRTKHRISLFLVSVLLGGMLTVQFSTVHRPKVENPEVGGDLLQVTAELNQEKDRQHFLASEIERLEDKLREYENNVGNREKMVQAMADELETVKMLAGKKEVRGNGVVITIEDSPSAKAIGVIDPNSGMYLGEFLYQLVNALNSNGAQAISIENHRIVSSSSVRSISANNLQVNTQMINPERITIKAVGNIEQMKIGMNLFKQLFIEIGKDFKTTEVSNNSLVIPPYDRPVEFKYAKYEGEKAL
jgi:uncharacterized protein YlxW (UPF0749 family)